MKKKLVNKVFIVLCIVVTTLTNFNYIKAAEVSNNNYDYSQEFLDYLKLPEEEKSKVNIIPRERFIPYNAEENNVNEKMVKASTLPESYDLRNVIKVNVENQSDSSWCALYASFKCLETCYLKKEGLDLSLSKAHAAYMSLTQFGGWRNVTPENGETLGVATYNSGANFSLFEYYVGMYQNKYGKANKLYGIMGPTLESAFPRKVYDVNTANYNTFSAIKPSLRVTKVVDFPDITKAYTGTGILLYAKNGSTVLEESELTSIRNSIKRQIYENGGVYALTRIEQPYFNDTTKALYINNSGITSNHAVTIIGWDDNYSRTNFNTPPAHNGAYIVLNSWGSSWGNNGVFYVSYDDDLIEYQDSGVSGVRKWNALPVVSTSNSTYSATNSPVTVSLYSDVELKNLPSGWFLAKSDNFSSARVYQKVYTKNTQESITVSAQYGTGQAVATVNVSNIENLIGDINKDGYININDVYMAMQGFTKGTLTSEQKEIVDVDNNGLFNINDIYKLMQYVVGKIKTLD